MSSSGRIQADRSYSNLFLLPLTIPPHERGDVCHFRARAQADAQVDRWAHSHLELGPASDLRLACSVEYVSLHSFVVADFRFLEVGAQVHALKVNPTTKAYRAVILPQLLSEVDRHQAKWFTGRLCRSSQGKLPIVQCCPLLIAARLAEHEETGLKIGQFSQGLTVRMMLIDDGVGVHRHLAEGLVIGGTVVEWVEMIAARGSFLYCQDTTSVHLARLVVFFHNVSAPSTLS